ncbi:MAG: methyl-accepting chemotaxis protein, partial [Planctomycetes bacterium]|nr:methyl-accepting chemotaxis protein [Planctomycetota bacterium]
MKIQSKLLASSASALALVLLLGDWIMASDMEELTTAAATSRARAVVSAAMSACAKVAELHDSGIIDGEDLLQQARQEMAANGGDYRRTKAFRAVPIVAAIATATAAAKAEHMELVITAKEPRIQDNDPRHDAQLGGFRSQLLGRLTEQVERGGEHWICEVDAEHDVMIFQHAITLTESCLACHGDPATSPTGDGKDALGFRMEGWQVGDVHGAFEVRTPLAPVRAEAAATPMRTALLGALVAVCGLAGLAWLLRRSVIRPLRKTVAALADIAAGEGDLTVQLDARPKDELGELARWFNQFLGKLRDSVRTIAAKAAGVSEGASRLDATAQALTSSADQTRTQSNQVAAAAEQLNTNLASVNQANDALNGGFRTAAAAVEQLTASIGEVAKSADRAATVASEAATLSRDSNTKVAELGAAADEIGRVIETIQDIAEQTNLLALNATIEA